MSGTLIEAVDGYATFECNTEKQAQGLLKLLGAPLHGKFVADSYGYYRSGPRHYYFKERGFYRACIKAVPPDVRFNEPERSP